MQSSLIHRHSIIFFLLLTAFSLQAQRVIDQQVYVYDYTSKEPIIGAAVSVNGEPRDITNEEGIVLLKNVRYLDSVRIEYIGYTDVLTTVLKIRRNDGQVALDNRQNQLARIVVWGRRDDPVGEIPQLVARTDAEQIAMLNAQTPADALELNNQAFVQRSQMGGGSPILRGFEANKVLLVVDGVRMNNAIYRSGHLQNSITLDPDMLEQIEVIYGPGSLIYGSDALGGVIHFRTRDPELLSQKEEGLSYLFQNRIMSRYSSANQEKSIHWDMNYGAEKWGLFTSLSFSDFGHLRAGADFPDEYPDFGKRSVYQVRRNGADQLVPNEDPELQIGTAYSQFDFLQKVRFRPDDFNDLLLNVQYSTSSDIPRYDNLIEPARDNPDGLRFAEWYYGPQKRFLSSLKWRSLKENKYYDKATFIAAYQRINEDRLDRRFGNPLRSFNLEAVDVWSLTGDFDLRLAGGGENEPKHLLAYGLELNHNRVSSEAGNLNIETGEYIYGMEPTRYPSGSSSMSTGGFYANYNYRSADQRLSANAGLRFSFARLNAQFSEEDPIQWPAEYTGGVTNNNGALTWGLGAQYRLPGNWEFRALASTAFRAPNIDDFGKVRPQGDDILVPNINLTPENAINGEISIGKTWNSEDRKRRRGRRRRSRSEQTYSLTTSVTGFYTYLTDAIVRADADLFGDTLLFFDGEPYRIQTNINANEAYVYGLSGNILLKVGEHWQWRAGLSYTRGREVIDGTESPLAHIPPLYGSSILTYTKNRLQIKGVIRFNGRKPLSEFDLGSSDNEELATPEGSLAWTTYNLYGSYQLKPSLRLQLAVENIGDLHYRTFSSGISAPGRNIILSVYWEGGNR